MKVRLEIEFQAESLHREDSLERTWKAQSLKINMRTRKRQTRTKYKEVDMNNISSELIVNGCEAEDVIAFGTKMHKIDHIASAFKRQIRAIAGQINTILNNSDGFYDTSSSLFGRWS